MTYNADKKYHWNDIVSLKYKNKIFYGFICSYGPEKHHNGNIEYTYRIQIPNHKKTIERFESDILQKFKSFSRLDDCVKYFARNYLGQNEVLIGWDSCLNPNNDINVIIEKVKNEKRKEYDREIKMMSSIGYELESDVDDNNLIFKDTLNTHKEYDIILRFKNWDDIKKACIRIETINKTIAVI